MHRRIKNVSLKYAHFFISHFIEKEEKNQRQMCVLLHFNIVKNGNALCITSTSIIHFVLVQQYNY